ncbi:MAG: hypothetical protein AAFO29_09440, partial [Actinomycetota bacterium]
MATPRWATAAAIGLRPVAITIGATFAVHRLSVRLHTALAAPDGDSQAPLGPYLERMADAIRPTQSVLDAAARSALLAAGAAVIGLVLGWFIAGLL